jgi:hypothetical protein
MRNHCLCIHHAWWDRRATYHRLTKHENVLYIDRRRIEYTFIQTIDVINKTILLWVNRSTDLLMSACSETAARCCFYLYSEVEKCHVGVSSHNRHYHSHPSDASSLCIQKPHYLDYHLDSNIEIDESLVKLVIDRWIRVLDTRVHLFHRSVYLSWQVLRYLHLFRIVSKLVDERHSHTCLDSVSFSPNKCIIIIIRICLPYFNNRTRKIKANKKSITRQK